MEKMLSCTSMTFTAESSIFTHPRESKWMPEFYDVAIISGENHVSAHRVILAAHSDFFRKRLTNEHKARMIYWNDNDFTLTIEGLKWNCIEAVIEYMYSAHITVTSENVYDLVECSDYFAMPEIKKFCLDFLDAYLCSDNCLKILDFAVSRRIESLKERAEDCLLKNFKYVLHSEQFQNLSLLELSDVFQKLRDSSVKTCESLFFKAALEWIKIDSDRRIHFDNLFDLVKLERLKIDYLANSIAQEELVTASLHCMQRLVQALNSDINRNFTVSGTSTTSLSPNQLITQKEFFSQCFLNQDVTTWFVISSEWMEKWVKYVTNDGYDWESEMKLPEHPGPIDNSSLFTNSSFRMLKRTLRPAIDYKFIPETAWELLSSWYGVVKGQPPVGEKGPISKRPEIFTNLDDELVLDPIFVIVKHMPSNRTCKKTFSKWDTIDEVDSQVRKLFGISTDDKTFLMNRFSRLDKTKRLVDLTLSENNEEECIRLEVGFESASASSAEAVNLRHSEE